MHKISIYHNPMCGTSRNTLAMIRNAGIEPEIIEYLNTPPTKEKLIELMQAMQLTANELIRKKGDLYDELGLAHQQLSNDELVDVMLAHPSLMNRPIVVSSIGTRLCRPSEVVLEILPEKQITSFTKEDGEKVVDENGNRI